MDSPKAGKCKTANYGGYSLILNQYGKHAAGQAYCEPNPPALLSEIIFHLDDGGMTQSDAEKHRRPNYDTTEIHAAKVRPSCCFKKSYQKICMKDMSELQLVTCSTVPFAGSYENIPDLSTP